MTHRKYRAANWEGVPESDEMAAVIHSRNIVFDNGFKKEDFTLDGFK